MAGAVAGCGGSAQPTNASATSGGSGGSGGQGAKRIGFVLPDLSNPVESGFRDGAVAEAKKRGWTVLVKGTSDAKAQSDAVLSYIAAHVDLIAMDPVDGNAMAPAVQQANAAGIPVIAFQSKPASGKLATYIRPSETVAGNFMGQGAIQFCQAQHQSPCEVGIVQGNPDDSSARTEYEAFKKTVAGEPSIKIVGTAPTDFDPAKALNVASDLLTAHPSLDYIYSVWDQGGAAAVEAIKARHELGHVGVSSQNGDCPNLQNLLKGYQYQDSVFFPDIQGSILIDTAAKVFAGDKLPPEIGAPVMTVTAANAKQWLSGASKPTKADVDLGAASLSDVTAQVLKRLKQAQAGNCPK